MMLSPSQSPTTALSMISLFLGCLALCILPDKAKVSRSVSPEDLKQLPIVVDSVTSEWTSTICSFLGWSRVQRDVIPEDLKQLPPLTQGASNVPYSLGQLWNYLDKVDTAWLLCKAWETVWLPSMAWIGLGLWRNVKRLQRKERDWLAPSSTKIGLCGKNTLTDYDVICRLEANTALMVRLLKLDHRLRLKELQRQRSRKVARDKDKKRRDRQESVHPVD